MDTCKFFHQTLFDVGEMDSKNKKNYMIGKMQNVTADGSLIGCGILSCCAT